MDSRNLIPFTAISVLLCIALSIGIARNRVSLQYGPGEKALSVPCIGSIQVLNGCGAVSAADKVANFLRMKKFDVKNIGNAESWNYPFTMVISRTVDMTIARQVAGSLSTDHCVLLRNEDSTYNVTVIIGPDYGERIQ
jgi:hypothetical protein